MSSETNHPSPTESPRLADQIRTLGFDGLVSESQRERGSARGDAVMDAVNTESSDEPTIELDQVFGLLKNRRRRDVLRHLSENDETVRVGELAEKVAARECEKPVSQVNSQERKRVYVGLYQCHLPKLADLGVIDYNKPRGVIDPGPAFEEVAQYLPDEGTSAEQEGSDRPLLEFLSKTVATGRNLL